MKMFETFRDGWMAATATGAEAPFLKVEGGPDSVRILTYSFGTFSKRAGRIANALLDELGLEPGNRVLILADDPNEVALLLHGCWLAGLAAVLPDRGVSDQRILEFVHRVPVSALVYPPAAAARMAALAANPMLVKHWVLTGSSTGFGVGVIPGLKRLDELVVSATPTFDLSGAAADPEAEALWSLGGPGTGIESGEQLCFRVRDVLESAARFATLYSAAGDGGEHLCWTSNRSSSFEGVVNAFVAPLYSRVPFLVRELDDLRRFWEQMRADGVTIAWIDQEELRTIERRGKGSVWVKPETFVLHVSCQSRFSSELLDRFEKKFAIPVLPLYSKVLLGGLVCSVPPDAWESPAEWRQDYTVPSVGRRVAGVEIRIVDENGSQVQPEIIGKILVRSAVSGRSAGSGSERYFEDEFVYSGDQGFYIGSDEHDRWFFVTGAERDIVRRGDDRVNLARVTNALYAIRGVGWAVAMAFPNTHTGSEIGAYVIPLSAANLTEREVTSRLRRLLDDFEVPKVVLMGEKRELQSPPASEEILARFDEYRHVDFLSS